MTTQVAAWVFGYGSLIFRPSFRHVARRPAMLRGVARRFYQGSPDHRGTPEAPGRVVTLIDEPSAECVGVAYGIAHDDVDEVLSHLDVREQGGYDRREVELQLDPPRGAARVQGLVYLATAENPHFLGPAPADEIARHVVRSRGPSGENADYVLRLASSLRELGAHDEHVFEVAALVERLWRG